MFLHLLVLVLVLAVLGCLVYDFYVHKISRQGKLVDRIQGHDIVPVLGSGLRYSFSSPRELWNLLRTEWRDGYPITRMWIFFWPIVLLYDPNDLEVIFSSKKHIDKSTLYDTMHQWLGTGLLCSTGEKWQQRRKMLTPSFHFSILEKFLESFEEHAKHMVESLRSSADAGVVTDIIPVMSRYTLNVICETAMGVDLRDMGDFEHSYARLLNDLAEQLVFRSLKPWLYNDFLFSWTSEGRQHAKLLKRLHEFTNRIVERRKRYHEETGWVYLEPDVDQRSDLGKKKMAMLDILIWNWRLGKIDDEGIREEVDTFVFEGQDTTSRALIFTVLCLAEDKEAQNRCRCEIDDVFDRRGEKKLQTSDLQQLSFLERCIKETLRLYPSVPGIMRNLTEDLSLKDYVVPAGTMVAILPYDVHRDPNHWPNPETFDPDRFLPERISNRHPFSYIPFSGGYRNCIGQKFALLELKMSVAYLLRNYHLEAVDKRENVNFQVALTLHPTEPIRVKFLPRHKDMN